MIISEVRNVNVALIKGLEYMEQEGEIVSTRNGEAMALPFPFVTIYNRPWERVLFSTARRPNPYFHLMEAVWMLAGRSDAVWLLQFNEQMGAYADKEGQLYASYGWRWRNHFGVDQIERTIGLLLKEPSTRRAVISMHDPRVDSPSLDNPDVPCNTTIYFRHTQNLLDMTVCCRSNDMIWGAYGANVVHMSMLHEYVASSVGMKMGKLYQISNDMHLYKRHWGLLGEEGSELRNVRKRDKYVNHGVSPTPMLDTSTLPERWIEDANRFLCAPASDGIYHHSFFDHTVVPMYRSYMERKAGGRGMEELNFAMAYNSDWYASCVEWIDGAENE